MYMRVCGRRTGDRRRGGTGKERSELVFLKLTAQDGIKTKGWKRSSWAFCFISSNLKHTPTWLHPRAICFDSTLLCTARSYFPPALPKSFTLIYIIFFLLMHAHPASYFTPFLFNFHAHLIHGLQLATHLFKFSHFFLYSSQFK